MQTDQKARSATLLVVDDDALITLNAVDQLGELGHVALEAFSASQALAILEERADIDALITDYAMPGMDGLELAHAARRLRPGLPILLVTGYADLPTGAADGFMTLEKPYREEDLTRSVMTLLAERDR